MSSSEDPTTTTTTTRKGDGTAAGGNNTTAAGSGSSGVGGSNDWCTIESDPGVFTEMLDTLGCKCIEFEELYSLDDDSLLGLIQQTNAIYGLIFLFQWLDPNPNSKQQQQQQQKDDATPTTSTTTTGSTNHHKGRIPLEESEIIENHLFFAHQVTTNACATQAILSVLFNAPEVQQQQEEDIQQQQSNATNNTTTKTNHTTTRRNDFLGTTLSEFYTFTTSFPPNLKGIAISSSNEIRTVHNSFAKPDVFMFDATKRRTIIQRPDEEQEAFHFIAYIPHIHHHTAASTRDDDDDDDDQDKKKKKVKKTVYELDGLQKGPIAVGTFDDDQDDDKKDDDNNSNTTTTRSSSSSLEWLKVARTAIQERMLLIGENNIKFNLMAVIQDKRIKIQKDIAEKLNKEKQQDNNNSKSNSHDQAAATISTSMTASNDLTTTVDDDLFDRLSYEEKKRKRWILENQRRRYNYLPFCITLLKEIAKLGDLPRYIEEAKERQKIKRNATQFKQQQQK